MGEKRSGRLAGWLKALGGTIAGLVSGVVMMYVTGFVNNVVKPAKPVPIFSYDHDNLTVTFHNRSTGGSSGYLDFGDGSPLEPISLKQELVSHAYPSPGDYTAKITLRNLIGEESERALAVHLDNPKLAPPEIDGLEVVPLSPGSFAPATFRITTKVKNAQLCVWDLGDDRPMVICDGTSAQDRLVTFKNAGGYVIKLAATNGSQAKEVSEIVTVNESPRGTVAVLLTVTDQAARLEQMETRYTFGVPFPPEWTNDSYPFDRMAPARPGSEIADVRLVVGSNVGVGLQGKTEMPINPAILGVPGVRSLSLKLGPDRKSVHLTGELFRDPVTQRGVTPHVVLPVVLTQQRRVPVSGLANTMTSTLGVPGSTTIALPAVPADWTDVRRQVRLELRDGEQVLWPQSQLPPSGAQVTIKNRRCVLTATQVGEQVRVDLVEAKPGLSPTAN